MVSVSISEPFHRFDQENGRDPQRELSAAEQTRANWSTVNLYGLSAIQGMQTVAMNSLPFLNWARRTRRRPS